MYMQGAKFANKSLGTLPALSKVKQTQTKKIKINGGHRK